MTNVKDINFEGASSHYVTLGAGYALEKEEVYLYFSATWMSKPVRFHHRASRYTHSSGLSEWRNVVIQASFIEQREDSFVTLGECSQAARRALDAATTDVVTAWLEGRGVIEVALGIVETYANSYKRALGRTIQRIGDNRYEPWLEVNRAVSVHHEVLDTEVKRALTEWATEIFEAARGRENVTRVLDATREEVGS